MRAAAAEVDRLELALMEADDEATQMAYATALSEFADAGGYEIEVVWDTCCTSALGVGFDKAKYRDLETLSGGEQKRLVLEYLLAGPDQVLLLDEPDNFLDVPGKVWLEGRIRESQKTILFISHDRELLANTATRVVTVELGAAGQHRVDPSRRVRVVPRGAARPVRALRGAARRWDEEHAKLKALVLRYKIKAEYNDGLASQLPRGPDPAAQVRGGRAADRPAARAAGVDAAHGRSDRQARGGVRGPGAVRADEALRPRGLVRRAGGRARLQRLRQVALPAAARRGRQRPGRRAPAGRRDAGGAGARTPAGPSSGARVRPGWFVQTHAHPELVGRTLLEILHRGDEHRDGMPREPASRALDRYELAHAAEQRFESLSGGQQARFQILLLELSGATLLLLDEPTDNLDVESAEALEEGLSRFEGTVLAVTHDRWFARGFDRFLVYGADGSVYESDGPVWDEGRVRRTR